MTNFCLKKKENLCWHQHFQHVTTYSDNPQNEKSKFKAAFRKYLNTHPCYSVDEYGMCKFDLNYHFVKGSYHFTL